MSAIAISNKVDLRQYDAREERYMSIVRQYEKPDAVIIARMFALLVNELEITRECVFGPLIAKLEFARRSYQAFTPWPVAYMMAKMMLGSKTEVEDKIAKTGYLTAMEPACGAGVMIIALAQALQDLDINYHRYLHVTAVDTDPWCVHMTYIQTSLLGIPACIVHGDSLRLTEHAHWFTPFHVLHGWNQKLRSTGKALTSPTSLAEIPPEEMAQISDIAAMALPEIPAVLAEIDAMAIEVTRSALQPPPGDWSLVIQPGSAPPYQPEPPA